MEAALELAKATLKFKLQVLINPTDSIGNEWEPRTGAPMRDKVKLSQALLDMERRAKWAEHCAEEAKAENVALHAQVERYENALHKIKNLRRYAETSEIASAALTDKGGVK